MFSAISLTSCKDSANLESPDYSSEMSAEIEDDIVKSTSVDKDGNTLDVTFNNTEEIATLIFQGDTAILNSQRPASGIWYKNDQYELRGKGQQIELQKDGEVIFTNRANEK